MSQHLEKSKLVKLVGQAHWELYESDLKDTLKRVHGVGLGGVKPALALAQADGMHVGEKRQRQALFEDDDSRDEMPVDTSQPLISTVDIELVTWRALTQQELNQHIGEDCIMNHYSLFTQLKDRFPLLFSVFRQVAPGISHEANVERVNSAAERLSDPNMKAEALRRYVVIARNTDIYGLDLKAMRQRYIQKYGGLSLPPHSNVSMVPPCMHACMYAVCVYACMRECVYACRVYVYAYMYVYIYIYTYIYMCVFVCMHDLHVFMICMYTCMHVCMYACMNTSQCMCACMHVYMYACIQMCVNV